MIPDTIRGIAILVIVLLPGMAYNLAYERQAGSFGVTFGDRTLRFLMASLVFHVLCGWPEYAGYRYLATASQPLLAGHFAVLWGAMVGSIVLPGTAGLVLGGLYKTRRTREGWHWLRRFMSAQREQQLLRFVLGADPAPRAWDDYFSERPTTYVRVRTVDGTLLGGLFASESYAAGYPQDSDLLLEQAWQLDDDGQFQEALGYALYVAPGQIAWLELVSPEPATGKEPHGDA